MPTAHYSSIDVADATTNKNNEGTPPFTFTTSSRSSHGDDVTAAVNSLTQRTKKQSKRQRRRRFVGGNINTNDNDDSSDDDCFSSTSSSSIVATKAAAAATAVVERHQEDAAVNLDDEDEEEELIIVGTSLLPLLDMKNSNDENNYLNHVKNNDSCEGEGLLAGRCCSCFIHLLQSNNNDNDDEGRGESNNNFSSNSNAHYAIHEHPLLYIPTCSVCSDRAEAVEGGVIDAQFRQRDGHGHNDNDDFGNTTAAVMTRTHNHHPQEGEGEVNACSWCGLTTADSSSSETSSFSSSSIYSLSTQLHHRHRTSSIVGSGVQSSTIYLDDIELGDGGTNELLLCDTCPRGYCVKCCTVSLGGHVDALKQIRRICDNIEEKDGVVEEEWKCCYCNPTEFLTRLREEYRVVWDGDSSVKQLRQKRRKEEDGMDVEEGENDTVHNVNNNDDDEANDDARIARLIDELTAAEEALFRAQRMLSKAEIEQTRHEIEAELLLTTPTSSLSDAVEEELANYLQKWQRKFDLHADIVARLQEELEEGGGVQMAQYYKYLEDERRRSVRKELGGEEEDSDDSYAKRAEMELDKLDELEGWSKGQFRGASGYKCPNAKIYKLEPEDLDSSNLNDIEDINTLEGQISQMTSNSKRELTSWRSKTGTTSDDIEMLKKKSIKSEERDLGGLIDLGKLEKNCIREDDDIVEDHMVEMVIRSKKGGKSGSRVIKQCASLFVRKKEAAKSKRRGRLSGDTKEYQHRPPPLPQPQKQRDGVSKVKKRAQLLQLSSFGTLSGRGSPVMKGMLMGSELASFEDSDVTLEVAGCESKQVSVCRPLASMLKEHQKEGLQFCWRNICHDVLNPNEELYGGVRGAILAHNMGLGKSFQAVCLLHTLMTHPSLVLPSRNGVGLTNGAGRGASSNKSNRIVHRAMLIAPVNTLANWEQEFAKWMGPKVPAVRFYSWTEHQSKSKIIKEWYEEGGILCCSSDRYASSCKGFLDIDEKDKGKDAKVTPSKNNAFFRKALFHPGPDIVVLDEVHTMLKASTSQIYKVLNGLGTKLRLALTGSPIQNNLFEYFRMASWVRPEALGIEAAFEKTYVVPIMDGMAADCTIFQAELQEKRSSELHGILSDFVHRRGDAVLQKELPFLQTAIIHVRQSKVQVKLYQDFRKYQKQSGDIGFFKQYHALRPVSNHPACLIGAEKEPSRPDSPIESEEKEKPTVQEEDLGDQPRVAPEKHAWICDICNVAKFRTFDEAVEHESTCAGVVDADAATNALEKGRAAKEADNSEWWRLLADKAQKNDLDINAIENGGKIVLLLQIIAHCDLIGDKVVVFSQCLNTLTYIEGIIQSDDWGGFKPHLPNNICHQELGGWKRNRDYVRIDGSVDAKERGDLISSFNSSENQHTRLFLLSTKAGGLGVNLVAANRVVLFDSHWNPAVDLQAVYRCYRYGQTKPTFCYRLLGEGSMEEKIYSRAAAKASLSDLVIDQQNPLRSFTKRELDLLQHENTWLCCEWCDKWRMLPPGLTAEEVEKQTSMDVWCCEDNIYDEDRQCCEAEERDQNWMLNYWEKRARQEAGMNSQSQSQNEAPQSEVLPPPASIDEKHNECTERDEVLQTLLSRTEEKRSASTKGANNSTNKSSMSWISKYSFQKEKTVDDESKLKPAEAEPTAGDKAKVSSPKKKVSSPKKSGKSSSKQIGKSPSTSKKNGKPLAKKNAKSSPQKNGASPLKKIGSSPTQIEKYLSPKKNGSSTKIKAEHLATSAPSNLRPARLSDRKRSSPFKPPEGNTEPKQPNSKKQKQKDDVIDLCDSD